MEQKLNVEVYLVPHNLLRLEQEGHIQLLGRYPLVNISLQSKVFTFKLTRIL